MYTNCRKKDFLRNVIIRKKRTGKIFKKNANSERSKEFRIKKSTHIHELSPRETTEINVGRSGKKEELPGGVSRKEKSQKWREAYIA